MKKETNNQQKATFINRFLATAIVLLAVCFDQIEACLKYLQPDLVTYAATCPSGSFGKWSDCTCEVCHSDCLECSGPGYHQCTVCSLSGGAPIDFGHSNHKFCFDCGSGQYKDFDDGNCYSCHSSCLTCYGAGINGCKTCPSGFKLTSM